MNISEREEIIVSLATKLAREYQDVTNLFFKINKDKVNDIDAESMPIMHITLAIMASSFVDTVAECTSNNKNKILDKLIITIKDMMENDNEQ